MDQERNEALALIKRQGVQFMRALTIHERGKGPIKKYFIRPTINGKTLYVSFPTREAAETFLSILPPATTSATRKTFIEYYFAAIDQIKSIGTKAGYYYAMKYIKPIAQKPISEITRSDIEGIFKNTKDSQYSIIYGILNRVSRLADDAQFEKLRQSFRKQYVYVGKSRHVKNPEKIVEALASISMKKPTAERARLGFLIMCYTGLRIGELGCLTPDDIIGDTLHVTKTVVPAFTFSQGRRLKNASGQIQPYTKGKQDRIVPLIPEVKELFAIYFSLVERREGRGNVTHKYLINDKQFSRYLGEVQIAAGVTEHITCHSARHIFGTIFGNQCENIGDAMKLQRMLGHKNFATTQRYISIANPTADDIASKMPKLKIK